MGQLSFAALNTANFKELCKYQADLRQQGLKFCKHCGIIKPLDKFSRKVGLNRSGNQYNNVCHKCDYLVKKQKQQGKQYTKSEIISNISVRTRVSAKKRNLPVPEITAKWIRERLEAIDWKCELTGIDFVLPTHNSDRSHYAKYRSPSIHRIDSKLGYTEDNVMFVLFHVNVAIGVGTEEDMEEIAVKYLEKRGYKCVPADGQQKF